MSAPRFAEGDRVVSAPGLHWLPVQRRGTVLLDNGHDGCVVYLDHPCPRSGSGDKRRMFFTYRNIQPLQETAP